MERVRGLDTLRFVAALWVLIGHFSPIPVGAWIDRGNFPGWALTGFINNLFSGSAAVIVFFVISGFCIHYPYRGDRELPVRAFLARRYARIVLPMIAALLIAQPIGLDFVRFYVAILWTLLAELIYYTLYPLIRRIASRIGWRRTVHAGFGIALLIVITDLDARGIQSFGPALSWAVALPCWLLGCLLAERHSLINRAAPSRREMWNWRLGILGASMLCSILNFHSPIGHPMTLDFLAIGVYFWLAREIEYVAACGNSRILEWVGMWSYSIYLMHLVSGQYFEVAFPGVGATLSGWMIKVCVVLTSCYIFHLAVERPAHRLARRLA